MVGTVGTLLDQGIRHLEAWCACHHHAEVLIEGYLPDTPLATIADRLICSACGSDRVTARPSIKDFYAAMAEREGRTRGMG